MITSTNNIQYAFTGGSMKKATFAMILSYAMILVSCAVDHSNDYEKSGETGVLNVAIHMDKVGALCKSMKATDIEMTDLCVTLSADGQPTIFDTIQLTGGSYARTERKTYPGLVVYNDGQLVQWTLNVEALDQRNEVIHYKDTSFVIPPLDTANITLVLSSQYSMLVANYFPIRDSVTRCELLVDNGMAADSTFPKQSLIGDTVALAYDYLTATPWGIPHSLLLNVYGDYEGTETLFYTGDTNIIVKSGEDANYNVVLNFVGPGAFPGTLTMVVTLGRVGKVIINGKLIQFDKYYLTMTKSGNGTVSPSDSVVHAIPHPIAANPSSGWYFVRWQVTSGTATIENQSSASTAVTLENGNATVKGIFQRITGGYGFSD
jgi:hypothetical protein